jgi:hypothetical protein
VEKFRLALITVTEFAMQYCSQGVIILKTNHEGVELHDRNTTRVGFSLTLSVNKTAYDEKVLFALINKTEQYGINEDELQADLVRRYIKYNDIISKFGLGMVIFPCILSNIGGAASVKYIDQFTSDTLNKLSFFAQD